MKSSSSEDGLNGSLQLLHAHVRLVGVPATWRSQAQTSMRAELPSGKLYNLHRCGLLSPFEKKFTDNALLIVEAQIVFLRQHRTIWQEHSAKDFASYESYKRAGILYVFPPFIAARMGQKIGRRPQTQLCGDALIYFTSRMLFENRHLACFICRYLYLILMRLDNL